MTPLETLLLDELARFRRERLDIEVDNARLRTENAELHNAVTDIGALAESLAAARQQIRELRGAIERGNSQANDAAQRQAVDRTFPLAGGG